MTKQEKQYIKEKISSLDRWSIDGSTLETVASNIKEWQEEYGEGVTIDIDCVNDYGDPSVTVAFYKRRIETDEEYSNRVGAAKNHESALKEMRQKQYEQLKKEFGE